MSPAEQAATPIVSTATNVVADVNFKLSLPSPKEAEVGGSPITSSSASQEVLAGILAAPNASTTVTFKLILVNVGNSSRPTDTLIKTVPVSASGSASVVFNRVPALTCIGDIHIDNGKIGLYSDFHGASDLVASVANVITVSPKNTKTKDDVLAATIEKIVASSTLYANVQPGLASQISGKISGLNFFASTILDDALNASLNGASGTPSIATAPVSVTLTLPVNENPTDYKVYNECNGSVAAGSASVQVTVSNQVPMTTYAIASSGNKAYITVSSDVNSKLSINPQTTAEALVISNPLFVTNSPTAYSALLQVVRSNPDVTALASVIETVYASSDSPYDDPRLLAAMVKALKSTLQSVHSISPSFRASKRNFSKKLGSMDSNQVYGQIHVSDKAIMGALTLNTSSNRTLRITQDPGTHGITTNVDYVGQLIELDPNKITWTSQKDFFFSPDKIQDWAVNMNSAKIFFVKGEMYWVANFVDFIQVLQDKLTGAIGDFLAGLLFDDGMTFDHDGIYVMVAYSGSPSGPLSNVYSEVKASPWQYTLWKSALRSNMIELVGMLLNVGLDATAVLDGGDRLTSIDFNSLATTIDESITTYLSGTGEQQTVSDFMSFFLGLLIDSFRDSKEKILNKKLAGGKIENAAKSLLSKLGDFGKKAAKEAVTTIIGIFQGAADFGVDVFSIGTRLGDLWINALPREYAVISVGKPLSDFAPTTVAPVISSLEPTSMIAQDASQALMIHGSNFQFGATIRIRESNFSIDKIKSTHFVSSSLLTVVLNVGATPSDAWNIQVINPDTSTSGQLTFSAISAPTMNFGDQIGSFSGVVARSDVNEPLNPPYNNEVGSNTGLEWQCVEFMNRYYFQVNHVNLRSIGGFNASATYPYAAALGLNAMSNGGTASPQVGDILCFSGGTGGYGHVAIIRDVGPNYVVCIQQHVKNDSRDSNFVYDMTVSGGNYTVSAARLGADYSCQGWLRYSGDSPTVPGIPSNVVVTGGDSKVTISWDNSNGATGYNLYWSNNPDVTKSSKKVIGAINPYPHTSLTNSVPYYYAVSAVNGIGESGLSTEVSATPNAVSPGTTEIDLGGGVKMNFVEIPGGLFVMGSPATEANRDSDEVQHNVTLSPFYMGKYEVTQAQYTKIIGTNPSYFVPTQTSCSSGYPDTSNQPVETVSWYDSVVFCNKLSISQSLTPVY
ncbi:MAG: SUMF1/EgtB/PvdO family nonheme iron enzyme [Candidatus Riflebacteria bacterium]|nr:SUMF1/EgtB/PvdO family nonheme iron enzyme [Candidatus Riflebacteria bacterium]